MSLHNNKKNKQLRRITKTDSNYITEKNLMSRQQQHNCFNKNEVCIILKLFLTLTARKNFVFAPRFRKQKPSLVL